MEKDQTPKPDTPAEPVDQKIIDELKKGVEDRSNERRDIMADLDKI